MFSPVMQCVTLHPGLSFSSFLPHPPPRTSPSSSSPHSPYSSPSVSLTFSFFASFPLVPPLLLPLSLYRPFSSSFFISFYSCFSVSLSFSTFTFFAPYFHLFLLLFSSPIAPAPPPPLSLSPSRPSSRSSPLLVRPPLTRGLAYVLYFALCAPRHT
jgi:hypothetical protein